MQADFNILIRGSNDIASATRLRFFQNGYTIALHDSLQPTTTRRKMAFADAIFDGVATLEGVESRHAKNTLAFTTLVSQGNIIPLATFEFSLFVGIFPCDVLVDARMRKHQQPEVQIHLAPLTIGLGPNFIAGENVHIAIETVWGEYLGDITKKGATRPLEGEPKPIEGHARDRYVYVPVGEMFRTHRQIGEVLSQGEEIAQVNDMPLYAPIRGTLRGLIRDGVQVILKTKVIEVDPRIQNPQISGVAERFEKIAQGVLKAVETMNYSAAGLIALSFIPISYAFLLLINKLNEGARA